MNIIGFSTARSGSGYCFESISKLLKYNYLSEYFNKNICDEIFENGTPNFNLQDELIRKDMVFKDIDKNKRVQDYNFFDNTVSKILSHQLENLDFNRLYFNSNNHFIFLYRKNNVNRIASQLIGHEHNRWRYTKEYLHAFKSFYFANKHKCFIEKNINDMHLFKEYYHKYSWDDIYCYEDFTFNPCEDFLKYNIFKLELIKNNPIKTPVDYEDVILNFDELKEYIISNYGEYYDIESN
jgi:hypothetical protein